MPTRSRRAVLDSDPEAEELEDESRPAKQAKRGRTRPGPDLDERNIVKETRSRRKTAARKTMDQDQEMKRLRQELLQANKRLTQLTRGQSEDSGSHHRDATQLAEDGEVYDDDDERVIESEDEPDVSQTPFRSLGTVGHLSNSKNPPRKLVRREIGPPPLPPSALPPSEAPLRLSVTAHLRSSSSDSSHPRLTSSRSRPPSARSASHHSTAAPSPPRSRIPSVSPAPARRSASPFEIGPANSHGEDLNTPFNLAPPSSTSEYDSQVEPVPATSISGRTSTRALSTSGRSRSRSRSNASRPSELRSQPLVRQSGPRRQDSRQPTVTRTRNSSSPQRHDSEASNCRHTDRPAGPDTTPQLSHRSDAHGRKSARRQASDRRMQEQLQVEATHSPPFPQRPLDSILYQAGNMPAGRKGRVMDYQPVTQKLIHQGCDLFNLNLVTIHAFPSAEQASKWAIEAWATVCQEADKVFPQEDSERVHKLIINQASTFRGHLRDCVSPHIAGLYGFGSNTAEKSVEEANVKLYHYLLEGSPPRYCYKFWDQNTPEGYAQHPLLMSALQEHLFGSPRDIGSRNQHKFNPVPLPTIAFLFTIVRFCLDKWEHGKLNRKLKFTETDYGDHKDLSYRNHLDWVKDWSETMPDAVRRLRTLLFNQLLKSGLVQPASGEAAARFSSDARQRLQDELAAFEQMENPFGGRSGSAADHRNDNPQSGQQ